MLIPSCSVLNLLLMLVTGIVRDTFAPSFSTSKGTMLCTGINASIVRESVNVSVNGFCVCVSLMSLFSRLIRSGAVIAMGPKGPDGLRERKTDSGRVSVWLPPI